MKKLTLIFSLAFVCSSVFAQKFGFDVGFGNYWTHRIITDEIYRPQKPVIRPSIHFQSEFKLFSNVSLNVGLGYEVKGTQIDYEKLNRQRWVEVADESPNYAYPFYGQGSYTKVKFNYLVLPVNLHFGNDKVSVFAGGYAGLFLTGAVSSYQRISYYSKNKVSHPEFNYTRTQDFELSPGRANDSQARVIKPWDYGIQFGVRAKVVGPLYVSFEYSQGLQNIIPAYIDSFGKVYPIVVKEYNRSLIFKIACLFSKKTKAIDKA